MINVYYAYAYCCEDISLIQNYYEAINDDTQTWVCHHRLEVELNKSKPELIEEGLYFHRPASELIFVTKADHIRIHFTGNIPWNKGKTGVYSKETIMKMSESSKGNTATFGKHWTLSEESKKNISNGVKKSVERGRKKPKSWKWDEEKRKNYIPWNKGNHKNKDNE